MVKSRSGAKLEAVRSPSLPALLLLLPLLGLVGRNELEAGERPGREGGISLQLPLWITVDQVHT